MKKLINSLWFARVLLLLIGLLLMLSGLATLLAGDIQYLNYWGGAVFAPLPIALGVCLLVVVFWKWNALNERLPKTKRRGKAARLARQAERTKFPIDEFRKW